MLICFNNVSNPEQAKMLLYCMRQQGKIELRYSTTPEHTGYSEVL